MLTIAISVAGAITAAGPKPEPAPRTWAVVVGVGSLVDRRLPEVVHGPVDAERVRDMLTTLGGVPAKQVLTLSDGGVTFLDPRNPQTALPTRRNVRLAVTAWLGARVRQGDLVVFAYSGQGAFAPNGQPVLVTTDALSDALAETGLGATWLVDTLAGLPGEAALWLDTSFAGRGVAKPRAPPAKAPPPAQLEQRLSSGVALWLAAPSDRPATERGPHGAFTAALLEAMREAGSSAEAWDRLVAAMPEGAPRPVRAGTSDLGPLFVRRAARERPQLVLQSPHLGSIVWAGFDPSGRRLATAGSDGIVKLWSTVEHRVLANLEAPGDQPVINWSGDGRHLLANGPGGVALWSASGRELWRAESDAGEWPDRLAVLQDSWVSLVRFSADGKLVIIPSDEVSEIRAVTTGEVVATLPPKETSFGPAAWDPRGRWLAIPAADRLALLIYRIGTWKLERSLEGAGAIAQVVFSGDGRTLAVTRIGPDGRKGDFPEQHLALYDVERAFRPRRLRAPLIAQLPIAASPDGRTLAVPRIRGLTLVELATLNTVESGENPAGKRTGGLIQFAQDSKSLAVYMGDDTRLYGVDGALTGTIPGEAVALAPDLGAVLTGSSRSWGDALQFRDLRGRHPPRSLEAEGRPILGLSGVRGAGGALTRIVVEEFGNEVIWDVASGRPIAGPPTPAAAERAPSLTVRAGGAGELAILTADGAALGRVPRSVLGEHEAFQATMVDRARGLVALWPELRYPRSLCILAPDPSACHKRDSNVRSGAEVVLWDLTRSTQRAVLRGHRFPISGVVVSSDEKTLVTASLDTTLRVWDAASGRSLATVALLPRAEGGAERWVIMSPDGLFDGSPQGQAEMQWRVGDSLFRLEQFAGELYTPGLFARLLAGERPRAPLAVEDLEPPPKVRIVTPRANASVGGGTVTVSVEVQDAGGGTSPAWLYVNGRRVPPTRARPPRVPGHEAFEIELVEGQNHLRATAFNQDGTIESAGDEITLTWDVPAAERPVLHVVAVGIDDYVDPSLRLSFAGADATAVSGAFEPGLFARVERTELRDRAATRDAIRAAIADVARRARPRDALVVYLAGHGALVGSTFYFLPADVRIGSDDDLAQTGLSQAALAESLMQVPATKQLVVLDACHSGAGALALGRMIGQRDALGLARAQRRLARASGVFLVAASTAAQKANEIRALGHGILTYALLTGLGAKGDAPAARLTPEGTVTMNALLAWLDEEVPRLTARYQGGPQNPVQASTGQDFPIVRAGD